MKSSLHAYVLTATMLASAGALGGDVNVGVSISGELQPGVYGQVNIGTMPNYSLVYPQPMIITQHPGYAVPMQPLYLHVPPGHAKHWGKHCHKYNACARPVYFLRSSEYDPHYHAPDHGGHGHPGKSKNKGHNGHKGHKH